MTSLKEILQSDLTAAVRARDEARKRALRSVLALIHSAEARDATPENPVARDLSDDEIREILRTEAEHYRRTTASYDQLGHGRHAEAARAELAVLDAYIAET